MTIICMQVKRCHFPGFTAKNAGGLMWFSMNKNRKKELQTLQTPQYRTRMVI